MKVRRYGHSRLILGDSLDVLARTTTGAVQTAYLDPPFNTGKAQTRHYGSYLDANPDFRKWLRVNLREVQRTLTVDGMLFLHLDYRESHYAKVMLDKIFGPENFVNEIVWCYQSGGAGKRTFAKKHDTILAYSKTPDYKWNVLREPYPNDYGDRPGFHPDGRIMNDWWQIPILSTSSNERTGYPSQKPPELVRRAVLASSDPGDLVLDCFVGSGTTAAVAMQEDRLFIVGDNNPDAIRSTKKMLKGVSSE